MRNHLLLQGVCAKSVMICAIRGHYGAEKAYGGPREETAKKPFSHVLVPFPCQHFRPERQKGEEEING